MKVRTSFAWLACIPILAASQAAQAQSLEESDRDSLESLDQAAANARGVQVDQVVSQIVASTNEFRDEQGFEPVEENEKLMTTAQTFAEYMARTDTYGHAADGNRPSQRAAENSYEYCMVSENIAYQFSSTGFATAELAQKFVTGWKESPGHRRNMLDAAVVDTGVGVAHSEQTGHWYAVQMFGRPKSAAIEFRIANHADAAVKYQIGERSFDLPPRYRRTHTCCRPATIDFQMPDGSSEDLASLEPADGDSYVIERGNGKLTVRRQGSSESQPEGASE